MSGGGPLTRRRFLAAAAATAALAACGTDDRTAEPASEVATIAYGDDPLTVGELTLPPGDGPHPVVVLIHGGFWRAGFRRDLMAPLAATLDTVVTWNFDYRAVGNGGGWPTTFTDIAAAIDALATMDAPLDLDRVAVVGHSAGGHLAVWAAARHTLPPGAPGADPAIRPVLAVSQAGVLDLVACVDADLGGGACTDLLGVDPSDDPDRYGLASPVERLPLGVEVCCVHGDADRIVPIDQSERFVAHAIAAGDAASLERFVGADHFAVIDPTHRSWAAVQERLRSARISGG